jgi:phosphatidate cytidylyltransferase
MNQFLRNLTAEQQVSALFIIVFGLLFLIPCHGVHAVAARTGRHTAGEVVLLGDDDGVLGGLGVGRGGGHHAVAIVAHFLRCASSSRSRPRAAGDHRSLVLAFFVVLPIQFWLVATAHFDLFTVFIPVYVFWRFRWSARWPTTRSAFWSAMPSCSGASWSASMA